MDDARTPVIVGAGEVTDRPAELMQALEPLALMEAAARKAEGDAGAGGLLDAVDSVDVVHIASWRYTDVVGDLCRRLKIAPKRQSYTPVGGQIPVKLLHEASLRIARGESRAALVAGAEAQHASSRARAQNITLPWTPFDKHGPKGQRGSDMVHPLAADVEITMPVNIYPFYEVAASAAWGQTPAEALRETGEVWARCAAVAETRKTSWLKRHVTAEEIITSSPDNRPIAYPYNKLMVANPQVNMGAAVIVTGLAFTRELGLVEDRLVHVLGGAAANEPADFLARDQFVSSHAQDAVLQEAKALSPGGFDAMEFYSCFPCVPKMARRSLGLGADFMPSVGGGMTFFGAPLNDYMLHAACAMTERLRSQGGTGLLYGQGDFVTKHHALVVSSKANGRELKQDYSVQADADGRRGAVPELVAPQEGRATVESCTVLYERDGSVRHGVVIARLADGRRTIAKVAGDDEASIGVLTAQHRTPVGREGVLAPLADGKIGWRVSA